MQNGDEVSLEHTLRVAPLEGGQEQECTTLTFGEEASLFQQMQVFGTDVFVTNAYEGTEIRVYDFTNGEATEIFPMPDEFSGGGNRALSCTKNGKLIVYSTINFDTFETTPQFFYCDISTIGTPDFQWYEVEKVN